VLHAECAGHPEGGVSSLNRGGDVEAEEKLWPGSAPMATVASGDRRCPLQV
jgi:hypothetical protein